VIVAAPPDVEPGSARVVRTRAGGAPIAAIRLGMAQLTNTVARAVLLVPCDAESVSLPTLLALVDAGKRSEGAIVAFEATALDGSPLFVPRDAWLELVTVGEGGMDAVTARRPVVRVEVSLG
jgi:molybdopterin-guanine dinucleotide biosynthesis protein A